MMNNLSRFTFFASLGDFFNGTGKSVSINYSFSGSPSVKDAIEALGVPHTEVAFISSNGTPVDFSYHIKGGETMAVYPYDDPHIKRINPLFPLVPTGRPSFVADVHLGRLARFMRVAGFDTLYENEDMGDKVIAHLAARENRIVLTRDMGLLKRSIIQYGCIIRSSASRQQFREVVSRYSLKKLFRPFSRCVHCNGSIGRIEKKEIESSIPEGIKRDFKRFFICMECRHVYWEGSHYARISEMLKSF